MSNNDQWVQHAALIEKLQGNWRQDSSDISFTILGTGISNVEGLPAHQGEGFRTYFTLWFDETENAWKFSNPALFWMTDAIFKMTEDEFFLEGFPVSSSTIEGAQRKIVKCVRILHP